MVMTHYMELLSSPLNLILFMAIPVILAETIAITELYILYNNEIEGPVRRLNRICSIVAGLYFGGVFVHLLFNAVIPLTQTGQWRGFADIVAVGFYLAGVVPLGGMALLDLGLIGRARDARGKLALHAIFVAIFLIVAHIAMIFGMLDPRVLGWSPPADAPAATQQMQHQGH